MARLDVVDGVGVRRLAALGSPAADTPSGDVGVYWNDVMLTEWRRRWTDQDTYWTTGQMSTNSPGDGARIDGSATSFHSGTTQPWEPAGGAIRSKEQTGGGLGDSDSATEGRNAGFTMRDAAFRCLMTENASEIAAVKSHFMSEIGQPWMDVTNADWWDQGAGNYGDINPLFAIAGGIWHRYLWTYGVLDYLGEMSSAEQDTVRVRMEAAANFCIPNMRPSGYNDLFVDREAGTITSHANDGAGRDDAYQGGPRIPRIGYFVNNRRAEMAAFIGLVGALWGDQSLIDESFGMVRDWVRFGVSPDGAISEFERETSSDAQTGWRYGGAFMGKYGSVGLALTLLRNDRSVIDLASNVGSSTGPFSGPVDDGTSDDGSDISLHFGARCLLKYVDSNVYSRLGVLSGDPIDGGTDVHEAQASIGNVVWNDPYIADVLDRTAPGVGAWGTRDTPDRFQGNSRQLPGFMFMFGGLEGSVT